MADRNPNSYENRIHSSSLVPYNYYENAIPDLFLSVPMHWHSEFEINYICEGIGEFICEDRKFDAYKGDIILFPADHLHSIYARENYKLLFHTLVFDPSMLGTDLQDRSSKENIQDFARGRYEIYHIPTTAPYYEEARQCVEAIMQSAKENSTLSDILLKSELFRLIWLIETNEKKMDLQALDVHLSSVIRPCISYISDHYDSEISIDKLAGIAALSESYFMSCFKKAVGISAIEYVLQVRIRAACEQLQSTNGSVSEIAYRCGFNNLSHFNRQFLRLMGCTPLQYRKNTPNKKD